MWKESQFLHQNPVPPVLLGIAFLLVFKILQHFLYLSHCEYLSFYWIILISITTCYDVFLLKEKSPLTSHLPPLSAYGSPSSLISLLLSLAAFL